MPENMRTLLIVAVIVVGPFVYSILEEQVCLGIFEERYACEAQREYEVDFKYCAEVSWDRCESFIDNNNDPTTAYYNCVDNVRCSCMRRKGNDSC